MQNIQSASAVTASQSSGASVLSANGTAKKGAGMSIFALFGGDGTAQNGVSQFALGFQRLLSQIQGLAANSAQTATSTALNGTSGAEGDSSLLLTDAQLSALNPSMFAKTANSVLLSDVSADQLNGLQQKLQQIIAKLGLQQKGADGQVLPLDLSKIDLSKLSADELSFLKSLAFGNAQLLAGNKTLDTDALQTSVDNKTAASDEKETDDLNALLSDPSMVETLQVLQAVQVTLPDTSAAAQGAQAQLVVSLEPMHLIAPVAQNAQFANTAKNAASGAQGIASIQQTGITQQATTALQNAAQNARDHINAAIKSASNKDEAAASIANYMAESSADNVTNAATSLQADDASLRAMAFASFGSNQKNAGQNTGQHAAQSVRLSPAAASVAAVDTDAFASTEFSTLETLQATGFGGTGITNSLTQTHTAQQTQTQQSTAQHTVDLLQVTIQKMAARGQNGAEQSMVVQLDPPSMGRVRVTLGFGDDGSVKARLVAERPETLALLQKEASSLERGLQNAGLTLSSDEGMSFDLSQQNAFGSLLGGNDPNAQQQNGNSHSGGNTAEDGSSTDAVNTQAPEEMIIAVEDGRVNVRV